MRKLMAGAVRGAGILLALMVGISACTGDHGVSPSISPSVTSSPAATSSRVGSPTAGPAVVPPVPAGRTVARREASGGRVTFIATSVSLDAEGVLSYDEISWFENGAAAAQCQADDVTPKGPLCTRYYWKNDHRRIHRVPVADRLTIEVSSALAGAAGNATPARINEKKLRQILKAHPRVFWQLTRRGKSLTAVREIYVPS